MTKIEISLKTLLTIAALLLLYKFLIRVEYILILLIIAYIIMAAVDPLAKQLEKRNIKRGFAILAIYLGIVLSIIAFISLVLVPLGKELFEFVRQLPVLITNVIRQNSFLHPIADANPYIYRFINDLNTTIIKQTPAHLDTIYTTALHTVQILAYTASIIVISLYMLLYKETNYASIKRLLPEKYRDRFTHITQKVETKLGQWVQAQVIVSFCVFTLFYVVLLLFHIKYALTLSIIAGFLEVIPFAGPVIAGVIIFFLTLITAPQKILFILIAAVAIHQFEGHVLVPKIMQKAIGLNPIVTIVALLVGAEFWGIIGAVLAVPVVTTLHILFTELYRND